MSPHQGSSAAIPDPFSPSWPFQTDNTKDFERKPDPPPAPSAPPEPASRYHAAMLHARGGLGEVYRARDQELSRMVALKRLPRHHARYAELRERFRREAEITACLEHPGIVPVYGMIQDAEGCPAYAMRFIDGETLHRAVTDYFEAGKQEGEKSRDFARQAEFRQLLHRFIDVCNTVAYAHSRGVIHRDIKPQNIMLGQFGETLLVDWGLAKRLAPPDSSRDTVQVHAMDTSRIRCPGAATPPEAEAMAVPPPPAPLPDKPEDTHVPAALRDDAPDRPPGAPLTQMGQAVGTPQYMSPEQAAGEPNVGTASDIYNLGATLYFLLTGKPPFTSREWIKVQDQICSGRFPRPCQLCRDVPAALEAICLKAMALHPADRYASSLDLAADLEKWLAHEPVSAWVEPWPLRVRRWMFRHRNLVLYVMVLLCTGLVATTSALIAVQGEKAEKERALDKERLAVQVNKSLAVAANEEANRVRAENEYFRKAFVAAYSLLLEEVFTQRSKLKPEDVQVLDSMVECYKKFAGGRQTDFTTRVGYAQMPWKIAGIYQRLGHHRKAEECLRIAKGHYVALLQEDPKAPCCRTALGQVNDQLGSVLGTQLRWEEAEQVQKEAVDLLDQLVLEHSESAVFQNILPMYQQLYASALHNYGLTLDQRKRPQDAEERFHDAGKIRQELAAKYPKSLHYQHLLANHYVNLGKLYANRRAFAKAAEQARLAKPIFRALADKQPDNREMWHGLAVCHADLGLYLAHLEQWDEADQALQDAMVAQELLYKRYPSDAGYAIHLGTIYRNLAVLKRQAGRLKDALHLTDVAVFVLKPLKDRDAWSSHSKALLRSVHAERAKVLLALNELAQAITEAEMAGALSEPDSLAESLALLSQALARAGHWHEAQLRAATVMQMPDLDGKTALLLACTCSRLASILPACLPSHHILKDHALRLLCRAEDAKLFDTSYPRMQLKAEEDLGILRQHPEFKRLQQRVAVKPWLVLRLDASGAARGLGDLPAALRFMPL